MSRAPRLVASLLLLGAACSPQAAAPPAVVVPPAAPSAPLAAPQQPVKVAEDPVVAEARAKVHEMLLRVSGARGLPIAREVAIRVLDRAGILAHIRAHVEKEIPPDAVAHEGELLAALELVPSDYDFVEGTYKLIGGRIAGFYETEDRTMYLVDDLADDEAAETLAHELDHALQDQSFAIAKMIEYAPGDGDRTAAAHAVLEGDATSAMLDVVAGSAFGVSEGQLRTLLAMSNAMSDVADTPHILQSSLSAPYADGFAFVQEQRKAGGWPAVDTALKTPPASTEQLLHADKYRAREAPIAVPIPTFASLGAGFRAVLNDVVGEQGLVMMLEEWAPAEVAHKGAAGWGGDRYVIARRDEGSDRHAIAVGWHAVMDTETDAKEVAAILEKRWPRRCTERPTVGPFAWRRRDKEVVVAAGPYERRGHTAASAATCAVAGKWVEEMLGPRIH